MKILVCISRVPDTTAKVSFVENNTKFNEEGVQFIVNPYDEWYSLVRALELKENEGGTVTVIHVGPAKNDQQIRKALAVGADNAVRIDLEPEDAYQTAAEIAHHAANENYDVVFTGKETMDYNGSVVGGMLAELLNMPYVHLASNMVFADGVATIKRDVEGGKEAVAVTPPFVVSAQKDMAEQRIPNMRGIMQARTKPLTVVLPTGIEGLTKTALFEPPAPKAACKYIDADKPEELWNALRNEAKII